MRETKEKKKENNYANFIGILWQKKFSISRGNTANKQERKQDLLLQNFLK